MPGRMLLQRSLYTGTAAIVNGAEQSRLQNLGTDTTGCIALGVEYSLLGFMEKMVRLAEKVLKQPFDVMLTGGDAAVLREQAGFKVLYEKQLVFQGIAAMVAQRRHGPQ